MDTAGTDITRISRKDLQRLHGGSRSRSQSTTSSEFNIDSYAQNGGNTSKNGDGYDDDDMDDLDDFALHDLRDIPLRSGVSATGGGSTLNSGTLHGRELDLHSQSSSSASTVIHNPELHSDSENAHLVDNIALNDTLEKDTEFQNKLHRSLKLSNANNSLVMDDTFTNDDTVEEDHRDYIDDYNDDDEEDDDEENVGKETGPQAEVDDMLSDDNSVDFVEDLTSDKIDDYIDCMMPSPPSSPPRELDPTKLYALFDFNGPDPSHLPLLKNDSVLLLNDSDSYWWLVRRVDDSRIGFAPAEILETYSERLARLNCWKNEILERGGYKGLKLEDEKKLFRTDYPLTMHVPPPEIQIETKDATTLGNNEQRDELNRNDNKTNDSVISIQRKGSLKKPDSLGIVTDATKKSVSFADNINELQEVYTTSAAEDDSVSIVGSIEERGEDGIDVNGDNGEENGHGASFHSGGNHDDSSFSILGGYQNDSFEEHLDVPAVYETASIDRRDDDDDAAETEAGSVSDADADSTTEPLFVPKKRRNFMIKNLDDYNYGAEETGKENENPRHLGSKNSEISINGSSAHTKNGEPTSESPDTFSPSSSAGDADSFISNSSKNEMNMNNVTISSTYTASASPSAECIPKMAVKENTQSSPHAKSRAKPLSHDPEIHQSPHQQRLGSMKMLDDLLDMYPEFVALGEGFRSPEPTENTKVDVLTEKMDNLQLSPSIVLQSSGKDAHSDQTLHPRTASIFDPVLAHVRKLDELLSDIQDTDL